MFSYDCMQKMNRTNSLIILLWWILAFFSISVYSAIDVYGSGDKSSKDSQNEICNDQVYDIEEYDSKEKHDGYYEQYETGDFEDRYGKPYYK